MPEKAPVLASTETKTAINIECFTVYLDRYYVHNVTYLVIHIMMELTHNLEMYYILGT